MAGFICFSCAFFRIKPSLSLQRIFLLYIFFAQFPSGQTQCLTLPCSESIAVYGAPPPPPVYSTSQVAATSTAVAPPVPSTSKVFPSTSSTAAPPVSTTSRGLGVTSTTVGPYNYSTSEGPAATSTTSQTVAPTTSSSNSIQTPARNTATNKRPSIEVTTAPSAVNSAYNSSLSLQGPSSITKASSVIQPSLNATTTKNCGQCSVLAEQVQVYYWPTVPVRSDCARASSVILPQSSFSYGSNVTKTSGPPVEASITTAVVDGFTFTYPSLYVSVLGPLSVSDSCGVLGATYTNPPPVAVPAITTASYPSWPSTCRNQGSYIDVVVNTLAISDIACPTWGVSDPFLTTCDGNAYITASYGAPYNPVILVPTEILTLDPAWASCTNVPSNGPFLLPCGIYDPPRALQAAGALDPGVTPAAEPQSAMIQPTPAQIGNSGSPNLPQPTTPPVPNSDPTSQPVKGAPMPSNLGDAGEPPQADITSKQNPPPTPGSTNDDPNQNQSPAQVVPTKAPGNAGSDPQYIPQTTLKLNEAQSSPGLGGLIYNGLGGSPPAPVQQAASQEATPGVGDQNGNGQQGNPAFVPDKFTALGDTPLTATDPSAVAIAGFTLSVNGPAFVTNGKFYSLAPSGNLIAGVTSAPAPPVPQPALLTLADSTYTANSASQFLIAGQTLGPDAAITVSGTPIALASGGDIAVIGTSTQSLGTASAIITPAPLLTFDGSTYTANSASQFLIAGQTLGPDAAITVSGTPIALASGGDIAVIGTSTQSLGTASAIITPAPLLTFDGLTYTANSASRFVIAGQTLGPNAAITVSGTPISLAPGGSVAVIGASTQTLGKASAIVTPEPVLTFDGSTYTENAASEFVIAGQTLGPGAAITVSGTPISLASGGAVAVIGTSTQSLGIASSTITPEPVLTFDGSGYTADASSDFIIDGQTLTKGGVITVKGTPISYDRSGKNAVIGTSTEVLGTAAITPADILTVGGQTFTANPTAFSIDGTTISAGGPGVTISGTPISLEPDGSLVVGTSTLDLPTATNTRPIAFTGAMARVAIPSLTLLFGYLGYCIIYGASYLLL